MFFAGFSYPGFEDLEKFLIYINISQQWGIIGVFSQILNPGGKQLYTRIVTKEIVQ
jgi:hypothetical protein